jgi:tetratricopeptide (TPR) repeat protein
LAATPNDAARDEAASIRRDEAALLALIAERRFAAALPLARLMTERHPEHGAAWKVFGAMLWAADSPEAALDAMHASVRLLPQDAEAHANLGSALTKLQRLDEAATCLRRALEIDPEMAVAHSHLGTNYQLQGNMPRRKAAFGARSFCRLRIFGQKRRLRARICCSCSITIRWWRPRRCLPNTAASASTWKKVCLAPHRGTRTSGIRIELFRSDSCPPTCVSMRS